MNFQTVDSTVEIGVGGWCFDVVGSCRDCGWYRWVGGRGFGFEGGGVKAQFVWNFNQGIDMCLCNWLTFLRTVKEVGSLRFLLHLKWWNRSFLIFTAT